MTSVLEACGTAAKIAAAALALTVMLLALPIGMTASAITRLATISRH